MAFQFPDISPPDGFCEREWSHWQWQLRHALKTLKDYQKWFSLTEEEERGFGLTQFAVQTTPYYARLAGQSPALRRIVVPSGREGKEPGPGDFKDPLGEVEHSPVSRIIHRYPDRVLFLVTDFCPIYCRYCTRKRFVASGGGMARQGEYQQALEYIRKNPGIREVILSGGDPLTLPDPRLEKILGDLRALDHIEIIRIGSRMPAVCPQRITPAFVEVIKKYHPVFVMSHFNHPHEVTVQAGCALNRLAGGGVPVFNQMVLINGVNNHPAVVAALSRRLLFLRVRPYYMFQCDPSMGTAHLRTGVADSQKIQRELWGRLSGLATPRLAVDLPGGGGKVELVPESLVKKEGGRHTFRGWDKKVLPYTDPDRGEYRLPPDLSVYLKEWNSIKNQTYGGGPSEKSGQ